MTDSGEGIKTASVLGLQDMPLIWSRIRIIETVAPFAMDEVNADAFAEAYKDLINLGGGQPAQ